MGHIIPLLEGGLAFLTLELFLFKPTLLVYIVIALSIFIILGMLIPRKRFLSGREFWHYLSTPLIFIWSAVLLFIFLENIYLKHFFILGTTIYLFLYFENLFHYFITTDKDGRNNFLRMTNLMNVVSIFFLSAGLFAIKIFIQLPIWMLSSIFFIFSAGLIYNSFSILKIKLKEIFWEILILSLLMTEFFIAIHFLPVGFYTAGAILAIIFYMFAGVLINKMKHKEVNYKRYVITGFILLFMVLLTARWV